jgi:hypothetical protein
VLPRVRPPGMRCPTRARICRVPLT